MIARLTGKLTTKNPGEVILDVGGVGYQVFIPLSTFYELPERGESLSLQIYTAVRENAIELYGFLTLQEKELFKLLLNVSKIGPKLAQNILSGISSEDLKYISSVSFFMGRSGLDNTLLVCKQIRMSRTSASPRLR